MSPLLIDCAKKRASANEKRRPFVVVPAKFQDVRRLVDIEFHAFENEQVNQVLSYRDYKKPAHFERSIELYETALDKIGSNVSFQKVVDADSNEIVSFTKFEIRSYTSEDMGSPLDSGHDGEPAMNRDWFALNERLRREYIGKTKHCYIGMLATEPRHQHNGAGTMLLDEILAHADAESVEVYLEATDTAKPFYEKHGFETITELRFDPAQYGVKGLGIERQTVMVRGAISADGERMAVRSWDVAVADAAASTQ